MDAQKERYRRVRGAILKLLAHQHPGPLDVKVLHFLLDDLRLSMTEDEMESHISYLIGKELVQRENRKTSGVELHMLLITPRGLDVLDGFISEVGVDVRF